jgi:hypothetical protein
MQLKRSSGFMSSGRCNRNGDTFSTVNVDSLVVSGSDVDI